MHNNNILIVTPNNDTFTNPTMTTLFHLLRKEGTHVFLVGPDQFPACPENIDNVTHVVSKFRLFLFRNPRNYKDQVKSYAAARDIIKNYHIKTILAVDPLGLIIGGRIKRFINSGIHLSYLSFEIFFRSELSGYYLKLKAKEIYYSRYIDSLLTQDTKRQSLLVHENKIQLNTGIALVPVSPMKIQIAQKPDLHQRFGISRTKNLVVYSGSVGEWCGTRAIIDAFDKRYWDENFHLVFHTRKPVSDDSEFYADLKRLDTNTDIPFTLHAHPFDSFELLSEFLSGFDVALALYYPNNQNPYYGRNMKEIGLSSGKFSTYMMLGLPTVVTECDIYNQLSAGYKFGCVLSDLSQIGNLLHKACSYGNEDALKLYQNELEPLLSLNQYLKVFGK
jgi:hypothetical protein